MPSGVEAPGNCAASKISGRALVDDDDVADLVERIDAEAQKRRLYKAMDRLSDGDRDLMELVVVDGLSVKDAAKVLGVSQVSARVRLHRARRLLRSLLAHHPMSGVVQVPERVVVKEASS
jgi:RNA polymerase sigma-70 factor, ECF subfamily